MEARNVSTAFLTYPISIAYLTGFSTNPHERLMALVIRDAQAVLIVPGLEEESATAAARGVSVKPWRDGEDPWAVAASVLGGGISRLAVEKGHLSLSGWDRLQAVTGAVEAVDVGAEVRRVRARKGPDEIEKLERAGRLTDQVTELILAELEIGRAELEVAAAIEAHVAGVGGRPSFATIVQSGPNSAQPHLRPTGRRIAAGDLVLLDFGVDWDGYKADITRTVVLGESDPRGRACRPVHPSSRARSRAGGPRGSQPRPRRLRHPRGGDGDHDRTGCLHSGMGRGEDRRRRGGRGRRPQDADPRRSQADTRIVAGGASAARAVAF